MFGIGTSEILIILLIALLVLGPDEIPKIARTLGRGMREIERAKNELRDSIQFEMDEKDTPQKASAEEDVNAEKEKVNTDEKTDENDMIENPTSNSRI
jgi:Tat protein translocase TatB subunit